MQRKTFESNRDMAVIAVTYEAGIFLSGRRRGEGMKRIVTLLGKLISQTIEECVETIKEVYQVILYCLTSLKSIICREALWGMNIDRLLRMDNIEYLQEYNIGPPRTAFIDRENICFGSLKCK